MNKRLWLLIKSKIHQLCDDVMISLLMDNLP